MNLGGAEIIVILVVALLVFGPTRLPEIGRQLGKAIREIRKIETRVKSEISDALDLDGTRTDQSLAPQYGDPTNVPDIVTERAEGPADLHDAPPPLPTDESTGTNESPER